MIQKLSIPCNAIKNSPKATYPKTKNYIKDQYIKDQYVKDQCVKLRD